MEKMISIKATELANALQKAFQAGAGYAHNALGKVVLPDDFGKEKVEAMLAVKETAAPKMAPVVPAKPAKRKVSKLAARKVAKKARR